MEETAPDRSGSTLGSYRLLEVLGRGGMGVVYLAEHIYIGKQVAVKILHDRYAGKDEAVQRFLQEARAASLINHPNIVDVTDFGAAPDGTVYFVMERLVGDPLDVVLARDRRIELLRAINIMNQMSKALGAAHAMGIVHRDLKPENVILMDRPGRRELIRQSDFGTRIEREGHYDFVKILDFGVAKMVQQEGPRVTQHGMVMGTPEYMAPETARTGRADQRSDIYSLGVMFYEMLTGSVPFEGEAAMDVMMKHVSARVVPPRRKAPNAEITEAAERVIMRAMEKDPAKRQQSMAEYHDDLQTCYGSVRYKRTDNRPPEATAVDIGKPIELKNVKRPATPETEPAAASPILLTRRKPSSAALPPVPRAVDPARDLTPRPRSAEPGSATPRRPVAIDPARPRRPTPSRLAPEPPRPRADSDEFAPQETVTTGWQSAPKPVDPKAATQRVDNPFDRDDDE